MPSLEQIIEEREARGEKAADFLSKAEVSALLKSVTDGDDWSNEDADQRQAAARQDMASKYSYRTDWETIGMPISDWQKIAELLKTQSINEFYDIYTTIISNLPRK